MPCKHVKTHPLLPVCTVFNWNGVVEFRFASALLWLLCQPMPLAFDFPTTKALSEDRGWGLFQPSSVRTLSWGDGSVQPGENHAFCNSKPSLYFFKSKKEKKYTQDNFSSSPLCRFYIQWQLWWWLPAAVIMYGIYLAYTVNYALCPFKLSLWDASKILR